MEKEQERCRVLYQHQHHELKMVQVLGHYQEPIPILELQQFLTELWYYTIHQHLVQIQIL